MKQRILTALVLLPLAIAAELWMPTAAFLAVVAVLLLIGMWEWAALAGLKRAHQRALFLLVVAGILAALAWFGWPDWFPLIAGIGALWWLLALFWLRRVDVARTLNRGNTLLKLAVGLLLVVPAWAAVALLHGDGPRGPHWLLYALALVWAADTFAYFVGSRIGGKKLAPSISPGKTWAGFWGGLGGVVVCCLVAIPLLGLGYDAAPAMLLLALVTGVVSVVGDLFESLIKRHSGAKDSGALIPGHGGVMDRIDSLVAALPVFAVLKTWLGL